MQNAPDQSIDCLDVLVGEEEQIDDDVIDATAAHRVFQCLERVHRLTVCAEMRESPAKDAGCEEGRSADHSPTMSKRPFVLGRGTRVGALRGWSGLDDGRE